ncbi:MAG: tetraacyldisaccharide 4'-kinase [Muribaculaceae bacterium]
MNKEQIKMFVDALMTPFAFLYAVGVEVRNRLFDAGILKQHRFDVPVISVGNITVGGTGKTPHVEYLIEQLGSKYKIGVLSRGYKRETKGFVLANEILSPKDLGDEPYQMYRKYGNFITLAVCENRVKGIKEMLKIDPTITLFLLDDAFQNRYVLPKVNIALVDYNRPPYLDRMLPLGRLREPVRGLLRSDIVVVTKCPSNMKPINTREMVNGLNLYPANDLYFSEFRYADPVPVFAIRNARFHSMSLLTQRDSILAITGIAQPKPFLKYIKAYQPQVKAMQFDDHHYFTRRDFAYIMDYFKNMKGEQKYILTTEKDSVRIMNNPYFPPELRDYIYYIPIKVEFLPYENKDFMITVQKLLNK